MDINRKLKMINRMIIICWCVLFACFIIKIIGYNFFEEDEIRYIKEHIAELKSKLNK